MDALERKLVRFADVDEQDLAVGEPGVTCSGVASVTLLS
jgi:hypothetical protein